MGKLIDANPTQTQLDWSRIDWRKIERVVLRLQHRIFMAKVKGHVKGMESLQRLLASSRAAKLLAIRKVGQENSGRKTPGIDGVVSNSDRDRVRLFQDGLSLKDYAAAQDAAAAVKHGLGAEGAGRPNQRPRCRWILDADIKSFFDEIDHDVILARTPVFRSVVRSWLEAGAFAGEVFAPTERGTPQGGVITPPTILQTSAGSWIG